MASPRNDPYRSCNRRISFDHAGFYQRLLGVFGYDPTSVSTASLAATHPSKWWDCVTGAERSGDRSFGEVDYLFSELFSKFSDGSTSEFLREAAFERFREAEEICRITNERLETNELYRFSFGITASAVLYTASRKIANLLGDFSWDEAEQGMDWGPGATYSLPRTQSDPTYKFQGDLETTIGNLALASTAIRRSPLWVSTLTERPLHIVPGNKVITVPKNSKTDRCIAIEPRMNMFIQKGIGSIIRKRLRKVGIDINDQSVNRDMARLGSITENLATIDLSMASDTVCLELVRNLLPLDWCTALEQCRSPVGVLPSGESLTYQKFSSMGNGYTFELETLLFWALGCAVADLLELKDRRISVYGDDIVYPVDGVKALIEVLEYCGFRPNMKKTFFEGAFRESCGGHYFQGRDVTPFYVRRPVEDFFEIFLLHNNLYRWFCRNRDRGSWSKPLARGLILWIRKHVPFDWRKPRLPDGFGDGAFIGTFDEACPRPALHGIEGFQVSVMTRKVIVEPNDSAGVLLKSLFNLEKRRASPLDFIDPGRSEAYPSRVGRARIVKILVPRFALLDPFGV